jgi:hypothetical protein
LLSSLRIVGAVASGETPPANEIDEANQALNRILKGLSADGLHLWKRKDISNSLIVGKSTYTIGPGADINSVRPLEIQHAYRRDSSNTDRQLTRISVQEYWRLPTKNNSNGAVSQYAFDPATPSSKLYVWPPESTSGCVVHLQCETPIEDMNTVADDFDIPQEWMDAIKWLLVCEIGPEYGVDLQALAYYEAKAAREKDRVLSWDVEQAPIFFTPPRSR